MLWNPLQPRGIQRNPQSEVYAPDAWTDGDLRFRWSPEAGGVLEVAGIPGRPLPYQMSCPSPSEGRRWTLTLAGMLRQGRLPPEGVFRASGPLPPPGSTDGRGGIVVGMYKGEGKGPDGQTGGKWVTMHGRHVYIDKDGQMVNPPQGMAGKTNSPKQGDRFDLPAQGQRSRFQVEVTHVDGDTARVSYRSHPGDAAADTPFSESDKNRHVKMPAASVKHFVNDLSGRVDGTPDSRHQAVNAVLRGEGQFLGKGDDGVVFRVGDRVVKVSTTVPYQPTNAGHLTPEAAADRLMKQADVMGQMRAEGIPGIPEVEALRHGDKAFVVMPFLDIPEGNKLTEDQFEQLTDSVKALHRQGWRIRDTIQAGIGKDGKVYQFDLGKAAKYEAGTQAAKQYAEDDLDHLRSVQIDSGIPDKHSPTLEADWEEARDPMWMEIAHERGDDHRARISELYRQMLRKDADDRRRDPEAHKASGRSIIKELGEASKAWKTLVDTMGPPMKKGRSTITILFKGKRIQGPVAFLTNKEDGHVFPVSASDPKAIAAMNTPRHREIVEKIHAETTDPKKKAVHAEHLAALKKMAGEVAPGHGLVIKPNTEKSFRVTGNTKEHDAALAGLKGASGDPYGSRQKNGDWVFSNKRRDVVEGLFKRLGGKEGPSTEKATPQPAPAPAVSATQAETPTKAPELAEKPVSAPSIAPEPSPAPVVEKDPPRPQESEKEPENKDTEVRTPAPSVEPSKKAKVGSPADKLPTVEGLDALVQTGDHIWGSRKDLANLELRTSADLDHINYDDANQLIRKNKLVPTWDLETLKGIGHSPGTAHMVQALIASIGAAPRVPTTDERKRYLDEVREVVASAKNVRSLSDIQRLMSEMAAAHRNSGTWVQVEGTPSFGTHAEAMRAGRDLLKENKRAKFYIRATDLGQYAIMKMGSKRYEALGARFMSFIRGSRDNEAYREAYTTALTADGEWGYSATPQLSREQGWEYIKQRGAKTAEKKAEQAAKVAKAKAHGQTVRGWSGAKDVAGEVIRSGHDKDIGTASAERTRDRFGLREVDYGQQGYMSQADREYHTKALEGALEDMAHTLGLPEKDISFNGRLGIAMGARGRGKAAAHYEPGRHVINITKFRGGGSLAHELGHALDNIIASHYVGKETKTGIAMLSEIPNHKDIPENIRSAVSGVLKAMHEHPDAEKARADHRAHVENLRKAADDLILRNNSLVKEIQALARKPATSEAHTRGIEAYQRRLAEVKPRADAADAEYKEKIANGERIPKALDERRSQERYTVESIIRAMERLKSDGVQTPQDVARIEEAKGEIETLRTDINRATRILKEAQSVKPDGSFYLKSATALGDYYSQTPEMWARAWESFIEDKMGSNGRRNTYLVDGTDVDYETMYNFADGSQAQPYPRGEERKRINAAFEHLLGTLHSSGALKKGLGILFGDTPAKPRQIVVMFKGDVASMEPLTTGSYSPGPAPRSGRRRFITEDDVRARARELSVRQRSREFIQRIHDGTQDPAKKAAHAARLEAYGPALAPPPGRQRKEKPFTGSITFQGIPIAIESEKGTWREGVGRDGKPWRVKMNAHYGEIHGWGTLGTDGDKLDAYVGPVADASHAYVIDQLHPDSGAFDEQKVMLGFPSESAAKAAYLAQFDKPGFYGGIHPIPMDVLKAKLRDKGLRGQPISHGRPVVVLSSSSR